MTIAARVPNYEPDWLLDLQSEGRIFEFWTFASGFMPMDEFRYSLVVKKELAKRWKTATPTDLTVMRKVLDRICKEGPCWVFAISKTIVLPKAGVGGTGVLRKLRLKDFARWAIGDYTPKRFSKSITISDQRCSFEC